MAEPSIRIEVEADDGTLHGLAAEPGRTVMEALRDHGFEDLLALCAGSCACATCHVYVDSDTLARLEPMSEDEDSLLDSSDHRQANSRLSCQIVLEEAISGIRVRIAPAT